MVENEVDDDILFLSLWPRDSIHYRTIILFQQLTNSQQQQKTHLPPNYQFLKCLDKQIC